jgi:hypothetical protein
MLHALRGADQLCIPNRIGRVLLDGFLALFDQTFHGVTRLALRVCAENFEAAIEAVNMLARLFEMFLEAFLQFVM